MFGEEMYVCIVPSGSVTGVGSMMLYGADLRSLIVEKLVQYLDEPKDCMPRREVFGSYRVSNQIALFLLADVESETLQSCSDGTRKSDVCGFAPLMGYDTAEQQQQQHFHLLYEKLSILSIGFG
jgi:hypothetical protein